MSNKTLLNAGKAKNDEFYTQLPDIERECAHYTEQFQGKTVLCNCDDPAESQFWKYFHTHFSELKLKKLISTHFDPEGTYRMDYSGGSDARCGIGTKISMQGNGDFRSNECAGVLRQADIVVTNPPFSLFREFIAQLITYGKKFLVIGNNNALTYKEIFRLIKENKLWLGYNVNKTIAFVLSGAYQVWDRIENGKKIGVVPAISWYTNLTVSKRALPLALSRHYDPALYPKYDSYDAINVKRVTEIPADWDGKMGVPVTFLGKYNPAQFEIIGLDRYVDDNPRFGRRFTINNKETYARVLIRRRPPNESGAGCRAIVSHPARNSPAHPGVNTPS
ncbi:MAG: adenine-specific methyltransferase EcoRI family protein [Treponema sp.]|jgi:hypothetical protein|nr:adenine-specific methyltransferase EcoRI family protein [Treponema sp.]